VSNAVESYPLLHKRRRWKCNREHSACRKALQLSPPANLYSERELGNVIKERIWEEREAGGLAMTAELTGKGNRIENVSKNPSYPSAQRCNTERHL
jgi:hypothetical protein